MEAKECDPGLEEAIKSIIYAAPRTEIKELHQSRQLLVEKYGKEFVMEAMENRDGKVAERVLKKLRVEPPDQELVTLYLKEIARTYGINWPRVDEAGDTANGGDADDDENASGGQRERAALEDPLTTVELSKATPPRDLGPKSPVSIAPPSPSTDNANPRVRLPGPPELKLEAKMTALRKQTPGVNGQITANEGNAQKRGDGPGGKIPDVDDLQKRFLALKR